MNRALVTVGWTPSTSEDVVVNVVSVDLNGVFHEEHEVGVDFDAVELGVFDEGDLLEVTVRSEDEAGNSSPGVSSSFVVPDLTAPVDVSDLVFSYTVVEEEFEDDDEDVDQF